MDTLRKPLPFMLHIKRFAAERPYAVLAALSASLLAGAYISQYGFGLRPCHLCLLQRYPYWLAIGLGGAGWFLWKKHSLRLPILLLFLLLFLVEAGIASYHAGVEWGLVPGPAGCTLQETDRNMTTEEMLAAIKAAPLVSCSQAAFVFLGLSMAAWNALCALGLSGLTVLFLRRNKKG